MAESLGDAILHLRTDDSALDAGINASKAKAQSLAATFDKVGTQAMAVGQKMSMVLTLPLMAFAAQAIPAAIESRQALAQVDATLASMGPVAGRTSEELQKAAGALEAMSLADDDDILKSVTANMLTFGNVAGEQFDRAQQAAVNMSARLGQDLQSSALQVGKALNDPVKGLTALSRVGIQFTAQQKEQIEAMAEAGDMAGAQGVILGELERQFDGAARAQREATPGADAHQQWRKLQEIVGEIALNALPPLLAGVTGVLEGFNGLDPGIQAVVVGLAAAAAAAGPLAMAFGGVSTGIGAVLPLLARFGPVLGSVVAMLGQGGLAGAMGAAAAAAGPFIIIPAALAAGWALFGNKIGPVLSGLSRKFQEVLGPSLTSMVDAAKGAFAALAASPIASFLTNLVDVLGKVAAAIVSALGEVTIRAVNVFVTAIGSGFKIVGDAINVIGALLKGDFSGAWKAAQALVANVFGGILNIVKAAVPEAVKWVASLYQGVKTWLQDRMGAVWSWLTGKIEAAKKSFFDLYDAVVGHSYVPDMVDGIRDEFARLDGVMVSVAQAATGKTGDAFAQLRDRVQALLDALFPQQAEIAKLEDQYRLLDEALANKLITPSVYAEARDRLRKELEKLRDEAATIVGGDKPLVDESSFIDVTKLEHPASSQPKGPDDETAARWREGFASWFSDGVQAALDGDLWGFLKGWFFSVLDNAFRKALEDVGAALGDILGQGGGGLGGLVSSVAGLFAGGFSTGGMIPSGQFGVVGEKGPEPVIATARGALVRPSTRLSSYLGGTPAPTISMPISIDATGADAAALARVRDQLDRLSQDVPGIAVRALQDAGERGVINVRGWR